MCRDARYRYNNIEYDYQSNLSEVRRLYWYRRVVRYDPTKDVYVRSIRATIWHGWLDLPMLWARLFAICAQLPVCRLWAVAYDVGAIMTRYRVVSRAHIRGHLLPVKKGERAYRGWLATGTEIEGQVVQDAAGTEWVFFEQDGATGFIWKARVTEVPEVALPARDGTPGS